MLPGMQFWLTYWIVLAAITSFDAWYNFPTGAGSNSVQLFSSCLYNCYYLRAFLELAVFVRLALSRKLALQSSCFSKYSGAAKRDHVIIHSKGPPYISFAGALASNYTNNLMFTTRFLPCFILPASVIHPSASSVSHFIVVWACPFAKKNVYVQHFLCCKECLFYYVVVWIPFYYPLKLGTLLFLPLGHWQMDCS